MAKKFYGVRKGRKTGVFENWIECENSVKGYPHAEFKSFKTYEEAASYCEMETVVSDNGQIKENLSDHRNYAFVDGSFNQKINCYGYGGFLITRGSKYPLSGSGNVPEMAAMRNVAGKYAQPWQQSNLLST